MRIDVKRLTTQWQTTAVSVIAAELKMSEGAVRRLAVKLNLGPRPKLDEPESPEPDEIARRAAQIRESWTPKERNARRVGRTVAEKRWTPPVIKMREIEPPTFSRNYH